MKNARFFLLVLWGIFGLSVSDAFADPVGVEQAKVEARNFYLLQEGAASRKVAADFNLVYPDLDERAKAGQEVGCYVFNVGQDEGFVVVSADDDLRDILAYSLTGRFEVRDMPENIKSWIGWYEGQVLAYREAVRQGRIEASGGSDAGWGKAEAIVPSLLENHPDGSILYNQLLPYNQFCPNPDSLDRPMVTGCVATAMAMLARYHEWPVRSSGNVDYETRSLGVPVRYALGQEDYDWENMLADYNDSIGYTEEEADAVALLMRDMGGIVQMDYTYEVSGAFSEYVGGALYSHMGYSCQMRFQSRSWYSDAEWTVLVKEELDAGRPLYYSGSGAGGGHAFVCDGYDDQGYFHFNWGWSGLGNGWYSLDNLAPTDLGTGAGYGEYNNGQAVITHIAPAREGDGKPGVFLVCDAGGWYCREKLYDATEEVDSRIDGFFSYSLDTVDLEFGVVFRQDTLEVGSYVFDSCLLPPMYGLMGNYYSFNPAGLLPEGTYEMELSGRSRGEDEWAGIKVAEGSKSRYLLVIGHDCYWVGDSVDYAYLPVRSVSIEVASDSVSISWTDPGLMYPAFYRIYINDSLWAETEGLSVLFTGFTEEGRYKVEVSAVYEDGMESDKKMKYFTIRDVSNSMAEKSGFGLFPNPASETFHLETGEACTFRMVDLTGRLVLEKAIPSAGVHPVSFHGRPGLYMAGCWDGQGHCLWMGKLLIR